MGTTLHHRGRLAGHASRSNHCAPPTTIPPPTPTLVAAMSCRLGVAGIAMDIRLLVCRFIWDDGFGSISDALECLRLCKEEGAHVSSNSWGGVPHSSEPRPGRGWEKEGGREGDSCWSKGRAATARGAGGSARSVVLSTAAEASSRLHSLGA